MGKREFEEALTKRQRYKGLLFVQSVRLSLKNQHLRMGNQIVDIIHFHLIVEGSPSPLQITVDVCQLFHVP